MGNSNQLPLTGVRVIDFGQYIAGPAVGMILADFGATVIHIDPPYGPLWEHPANAILQRNKLCLKLDLKTQQGLAQALQLIEQADIIIENFRPGVMQRLGINFSQLRAIRPGLITLSIPGFASNDSLRSQWKATEAIVAAASGAFTDMGFNRVLMGLNPSFSPLPLGSSYATSLATSSVVFALVQRQKTGRGDHIEVPIAAALMEGLSYNSCLIEDLPERYITMRETEIKRRNDHNIPLDVNYEDLQEYLDPFYRTYECQDGRMFYCVCPSHRNHAQRALKVLGIYDDLLAIGLPEVDDLHQPITQWQGETSIGVYPLPKKWANIISAKMKAAFLTKTSTKWGEIFGEGQIPGAAHRTTQEWVNNEHNKTSGLMVNVEDPEYSNMLQPGPIAWLEESAELMLDPKPRQQVTHEQALTMLIQVSAKEQQANPANAFAQINGKEKPLWLQGVKILDLTNVIAGPHSCAFMARFGAQVTKLDPITPLYDPMIGIIYSFQTDLGKQKILVNINTDEGREIFHKLIQSVDIVVINAPQRQLIPLGLDHDSLQRINPGVLFCSLDCFGGPKRGPKSDYIGYDDIIQSNSGIMSRFGGEQTPEEHAHIGTLDVNCGFAAGLAMGVALYHKHRTGEVSRARTSLATVTNLAQIPFAFDYQGRGDFNEPSGREAMGNNAYSHFYACANGWIFIDSSKQEIPILQAIIGLSGIQHLNSEREVKHFFKAAFKTDAANIWVEKLQKAGIAAVEPKSIKELRSKNSRIADGKVDLDSGSYAFSTYPNHPSGHQVTQIDHYAIRPTEGAIKAVSPTEKFGYSTKKILAGLDYTQQQIDLLIEKKVAAIGWGNEYLPS